VVLAVLASTDAILLEALERALAVHSVRVERTPRLDRARVPSEGLVIVDVRGDLSLLEGAVDAIDRRTRGLVNVLVAVVDTTDQAERALAAGVDEILFSSESEELRSLRLKIACTRAMHRSKIDASLIVAVEHLGESVELTDVDGRIRYVNPAFENLFGYTRAEAIGRTPRELLRGGDHSERYYKDVWDALARGQEWRGPFTSRDKQNRPVHQDVTVTPVRDVNGVVQGFVSIRRALTRERELEAQLRASERMAAIGTLAAGVAHEINNPLAYVLANIEHVLELLAQPEPNLHEMIDALQAAHEGGGRVRSIVADLNLLARDPDSSMRAVDLCGVLDAAASIAQASIRRVAVLVRQYEGRPTVLANESRLGQVALNLIVNAAQAIPSGRDPQRDRIVLRTRSERDSVCFEVEDTGAGMTPAVRERIFDPFFTTKPPGEGTGLGLSVCHQIVTRFGGRIEVESEPDRGTKVRVWLQAAEPAVVAPPAPSAPQARDARRLRVLIVDDEPAVCRAMSRVLREHDVDIANCGRDGLSRLASASYDVVICDLTMPDMSGIDLHRSLSPDSPVRSRYVFVTGGMLSEIDRMYVLESGCVLVHKPFRSEELRRLVLEIAKD
jgi:PAS domain S-box-containing protein